MTQASQSRRPARLLPLFVWPALAVLVGLGTWQVHRLDWKTTLIATIEARAGAPAIPLPADLTSENIGDIEFTHVRLAGVFQHDEEMIVVSRPRKGVVGSRVVTPIETENGQRVLVDRGWIPAGAEDPMLRAEGQVAGVTTVEGLLRAPQQTNPFTPDNQPGENAWYWIDPAGMAEHAGFAPQMFYFEAGPAPNPGGLPIGGRPVLDIANNHLQYAITWYGLAFGLLAVYVIYLRSERKRRHAEP